MDIFSKLDNLKSIEPSESWVVDTKKRVLSEAPVFGRKNVLENNIDKVDSRLRGNDKGYIIDKKANLGFNIQNLFQNLSFKKLMVPAFSLVFVLSAGVFTLGASKSSLPGEFLYSIKMINEDMALVVASENKKAEIEMEHAGKRLEEIVEISKKTSDIEQQEKLAQLMEKFGEKVESANNNLTKIDRSGEKTKIAKVINIQSEKYTEALAKTTENIPAVIKDNISEEVAKAIDSNEKIYLTSFAVMAEEEKINDDVSEEDQDDSAEDGDDVEEGGETKGAEEDIKEEFLDDSENDSEDSNNPDEGDVLGVEDNIKDNDEDVVVEEVIKEETGEDVVEIEVDGEVSK